MAATRATPSHETCGSGTPRPLPSHQEDEDAYSQEGKKPSETQSGRTKNAVEERLESLDKRQPDTRRAHHHHPRRQIHQCHRGQGPVQTQQRRADVSPPRRTLQSAQPQTSEQAVPPGGSRQFGVPQGSYPKRRLPRGRRGVASTRQRALHSQSRKGKPR
ncbi:hypothetical protein BDV95DRAFT_124428 [Massariosphaeria phaeospora]|uniref:Uncharacterized protein n=1 Tax=Massariosphaeria phaeospora TaxID=100035 RepID=A0A7C8I6Z8_9PLEO|nr:hypothetical protein BDV95DRAFT_124428 [Massariosphaeria phaeospora]